jgi:hypothetical protein
MKRRIVRRLAWVGMALCLVALAFGVTVRLLKLPPGVTETNVGLIRKGMTLTEVEGILGESAKHEIDLRGCALPHLTRRWRGTAECARLWPGAEGCACVGFDEDGRVAGAVFHFVDGAGPQGAGPLTRLRSLFGW